MIGRPVPVERVELSILELQHKATAYEAAAALVENADAPADQRVVFIHIARDLRHQAQIAVDEAAARRRWLNAREEAS